MTIDLSEFHDVFFEECFEGLDVMESGLLSLDKDTDIEDINAIFRAAHSIKGGGSSFGFNEIASFTHVMETLLDEMRDGRREVTTPAVDLLLGSVDVLRGMVDAAKDGKENDTETIATRLAMLEDMLANASDSEADAIVDTVAQDDAASVIENVPAVRPGWLIKFKPWSTVLQLGNDPVRIFRELAMLGELKTQADLSELPTLDAIEPDKSYLSWTLKLYGDVAEADVKELFSWVEDDSDLTITSLADIAAQEAKAAPAKADENTVAQKEICEETVVSESAGTDKAQATEPARTEAKPTTTAKPKASASNKESSSIRVAIDKVDELINMVGELVITQSMLSQVGEHFEGGDQETLERLRDGVAQLERNTRELQASVLQIRMLPISFTFSRFPRLVRDYCNNTGKQVELKLVGEHTEVDKTVMEKIGDPLVHLVRNSLDHGIEMPEDREAAGKPQVGTLELCAYHEGGEIVIQVIDDGGGLNRERILNKAIEKGLVSENEELPDDRVYNLIFQPGFSTAEQISDVSGRGVGMDVVRKNVRDLGGNVSIATNQGAGSTVTIRLPLTLAILDGQLVRVAQQTYIVSLVSIVESLQIQQQHLSTVSGQSELYKLRDEYIPIIRVGELFGDDEEPATLDKGLLMVVEADGRRVGLLVNDLMGQQQVVIKSLETNFRQIQGISGATILGDGTVALIIDVPGLIQRHFDKCLGKQKPLNAVA